MKRFGDLFLSSSTANNKIHILEKKIGIRKLKIREEQVKQNHATYVRVRKYPIWNLNDKTQETLNKIKIIVKHPT